MDSYEIQFPLSEEIAQELLWFALTPDALVMTPALNKAIEQQHTQLNRSPEGYQLTGISVTIVHGALYAELSYAKP